jgi:hypothetical protein
MARESARSQAQIKKDRDKAALEKQKYVRAIFARDFAWSQLHADLTPTLRADQAKAKLEKQKKAAKGERRA